MSPDYRIEYQKGYEGTQNYETDPQWKNKPLTPAQILIHDVRLESWRPDRGPMLEMNERLASQLVPDHAASTSSVGYVRAAEAATNPIEQQRFSRLEEEYGWMRHLRIQEYQHNAYDSEHSAKCRWIHCSSKFPEYLKGFLWALSDDLPNVSASLHMLDNVIQRQTRFSKHGKYFAPFSQQLQPATWRGEVAYPLIIAVPFLDWSIHGAKPPLRFQVDKREGFHSARSSSHLLRSVLQHFYRLEDTGDREASQVFAKHKPWSTNRELDLKVRQWYGHYPSALNVDELWILAIDAEHIVTLSSNQTWKSRWPPLQLTSRISDVAFRGIRNAYFATNSDQEYTSVIHAIACISGAVGMMHRSFWADLVLPCTDRYAGYLSHLQYRLHRSPSTKLVMDLIAAQEELNIVIQITQQQVEMISKLQDMLSEIKANNGTRDANNEEEDAPSPSSRRPLSRDFGGYGEFNDPLVVRTRPTYNQLADSAILDPMSQVLDNLGRELTDLVDLRNNTDRLVTRTIQLVNIRLEDHGKAILVFTIVTIIFLPLNFVSSFFGMNFKDIRDMKRTQWLFWAVALCVTAAVVALSLFVAFSGHRLVEHYLTWRDKHREANLTKATARRSANAVSRESDFKVIGVERGEAFNPY
jgi:uncharacterized membrane protein YidH (DUF202 family)